MGRAWRDELNRQRRGRTVATWCRWDKLEEVFFHSKNRRFPKENNRSYSLSEFLRLAIYTQCSLDNCLPELRGQSFRLEVSMDKWGMLTDCKVVEEIQPEGVNPEESKESLKENEGSAGSVDSSGGSINAEDSPSSDEGVRGGDGSREVQDQAPSGPTPEPEQLPQVLEPVEEGEMNAKTTKETQTGNEGCRELDGGGQAAFQSKEKDVRGDYDRSFGAEGEINEGAD